MSGSMNSAATGFPRFALIFSALFVLSALPVALSDLLPLVDYPNHLARMYILAHLPTSPTLQAFYAVEWRPIPDLAMDSIVPTLSRVVPLIWAGKLFVLLTFLLLTGGVAAPRLPAPLQSRLPLGIPELSVRRWPRALRDRAVDRVAWPRHRAAPRRGRRACTCGLFLAPHGVRRLWIAPRRVRGRPAVAPPSGGPRLDRESRCRGHALHSAISHPAAGIPCSDVRDHQLRILRAQIRHALQRFRQLQPSLRHRLLCRRLHRSRSRLLAALDPTRAGHGAVPFSADSGFPPASQPAFHGVRRGPSPARRDRAGNRRGHLLGSAPSGGRAAVPRGGGRVARHSSGSRRCGLASDGAGICSGGCGFRSRPCGEPDRGCVPRLGSSRRRDSDGPPAGLGHRRARGFRADPGGVCESAAREAANALSRARQRGASGEIVECAGAGFATPDSGASRSIRAL